MTKKYIRIAIAAAILAVTCGVALSAQDRYSLQVPNGLAFSAFKGYETWQVISVSQTADTIEVIVGNPLMISGYQSGIPGNGKPFADGSKMAKIHWKAVKSPDAPAPTTIAGPLHDVDFMEKDSKRFSATGGWGYAEFDYEPASDTFKAVGTGTDCGGACHTIVAKKDYVFTTYPKR